ncbi:MAG TPA: YggT family protein [Acidimicrobiia bacterium]|nr:YggT family protein [Acidimicrobiia bacterium]
MTVICAVVTAYMVVLFARAIMSWFPVRPGTSLASVYRVLLDLTEPVLAPLRRVIPPAGMFDLSFLVLFLALGILRTIVCR